MISLSGLSAVPGAYNQAQNNFFVLQQQQQQADALKAYGQALAALAGQSGTAAPALSTMPSPSGVQPAGGVGGRFWGPTPPPPSGGRFWGATPPPGAPVSSGTGPSLTADQMEANPTQQGVYDSISRDLGWKQFQPNMQWALKSMVSTLPGPTPVRGGQMVTPPAQPGPQGVQLPPQQSGPQGVQMPAQGTGQPGDISQYAAAIASNETGGQQNPYGYVEPSSGALGKYQVMPENVGPWTQQVLGQAMTPQQFLASPQAQEAVFKGVFGQYLQQSGDPAKAAAMWFGGPGVNASTGPDALGTTVSGYVQKFNTALGQGGGQAQAQPAGLKLPSTAGIQPGSLTWPSVVNAIKAANPGVSPAALALAVNQFVPLMSADEASKWKAVDEQRADLQARTAATTAGVPTGYRRTATGDLEPIPGGPADPDTTTVDSIAQAIIDGKQPPITTGLYKNAAAVKAALAKQGFDLSTANSEWNAYQTYLKSANGTQQVKYRESAQTAAQSLDKLQDLAGQWDAGGFPALNKAVLATAKQGVLGPEANRIATLLEAQVSEVASTLGTALMGGNSPTDHALSLAQSQLSGNWSRATLDAAISQARDNLQYRLNAMNQQGPTGTGGSNSYAPTTGAGAGASQSAPSGGAAPDGTRVQMPDGSFQIKQGGKWVPVATAAPGPYVSNT